MAGWTQEYDDARRPLLATKPLALRSLDAMRDYTQYVSETLDKIAGLSECRRQLIWLALPRLDSLYSKQCAIDCSIGNQ